MHEAELNGCRSGHSREQDCALAFPMSSSTLFFNSCSDRQDVAAAHSLLPHHNSTSFVSQNYAVIKELGKGSFSRVQLLRDRRAAAARVLKIAEGSLESEQSRMLQEEIHLLAQLDHPYIVKIMEYAEDVAR